MLKKNQTVRTLKEEIIITTVFAIEYDRLGHWEGQYIHNGRLCYCGTGDLYSGFWSEI